MKFSGKIGFWMGDVETKPGVYKPSIIEKNYTGDVLRNVRKFQPVQNQQNENLVTVNKISVISNLFLQTNWPSIRYIIWNGIKWSVTSVDISQYPRAIMEIGGVYNGENTPS